MFSYNITETFIKLNLTQLVDHRHRRLESLRGRSHIHPNSYSSLPPFPSPFPSPPQNPVSAERFLVHFETEMMHFFSLAQGHTFMFHLFLLQ